MAKVIMTIAPEDGMAFENILSFQTENYIGLWDSVANQFVLMNKSGVNFEPFYLNDIYEDLKELDDAVYMECEEHITEVFDRSDYTITLD